MGDVLRGEEQDGQAEGFLVGGGSHGGVHHAADSWDEGFPGLPVPAQDGAEQHQRLEVAVRGGVFELQVMQDAVSVELVHVLTAGLVGVAVQDAAAEDAQQVSLERPDELRLEEVLHAAGDFHVGERAVVELHHDLVPEQGNAEGQADAVGSVVHLEDGGLAVLEDAAPDVHRLVGRHLLAVGGEGEALALPDEEEYERPHLLLADLYRRAGLRAVVVQVEPPLAVPVHAGQFCNLPFRGLDEDKAVEAVAQAVVVVSFPDGLLAFP